MKIGSPRAQRPLSRVTTAVAASLLLLTGCAGQDVTSAAAYYEAGGDGSPQASLPGQLFWDADCLRFESSNGDIWLPVLPREGTRLSKTSVSVGGSRYPLGERVELPGGEGSASLASIPESCADTGDLWFVAG